MNRRKRKNNDKEREEVQRDFSLELPDWLQEFSANLLDESSTSTEPWETLRRRIETLPVLLMNYQ